ncbi:MAG: HIT family protein [Bacilli bacterium]|nr:HIT family protein [Bacilli bacterium]
MHDDVFCKIVRGEIPCYKLFEDEYVLAFLDISQVTKGHVLVIPKDHYDNFLATPQKVMHKVMDIAQRIGQVLIQMMGAKGVNILTNNFEAAGQTVMHFHVHVIPRYKESDGFRLEMHDNHEGLNLPAIQEMIKSNLE